MTKTPSLPLTPPLSPRPPNALSSSFLPRRPPHSAAPSSASITSTSPSRPAPCPRVISTSLALSSPPPIRSPSLLFSRFLPLTHHRYPSLFLAHFLCE
ncbi:hypothetical protein AAHC03_016443 [Spirometra sp. Aus1]